MIENVHHCRKLTTLMRFWMEEVSCHLVAKRLLVRGIYWSRSAWIITDSCVNLSSSNDGLTVLTIVI